MWRLISRFRGIFAFSAMVSPGFISNASLEASALVRWKRPPPHDLLSFLSDPLAGEPLADGAFEFELAREDNPGFISKGRGIFMLNGRGILLLCNRGTLLRAGKLWELPRAAVPRRKTGAPGLPGPSRMEPRRSDSLDIVRMGAQFSEAQTKVWSKSLRRPRITGSGSCFRCCMVTCNTSHGADRATAVKGTRMSTGTAPKTPPLISTRSLRKLLSGSREKLPSACLPDCV
mmetsp:Transcript_89607/g.261964  ORF Transcript_89607/g.261964 Transcript_89607/m.261964 type:complete len:231 (-) Transcript_89607:446-1138(-)